MVVVGRGAVGWRAAARLAAWDEEVAAAVAAGGGDGDDVRGLDVHERRAGHERPVVGDEVLEGCVGGGRRGVLGRSGGEVDGDGGQGDVRGGRARAMTRAP